MRPATLADVPALVALGAEFIQTTGYRSVLSENPRQMRALAEQLIAGGSSVIFVIEHAGRLLGMIGLVAYPHHISGERMCGEVFLFVAPDARGRTGPQLIRAAEHWAREQGAGRLELVAPTARVETLYQRLGYEPIERTYQRAL